MLPPRLPFALPRGRGEVAALCTPNIAFITRLASPRAAKSSSSPPCLFHLVFSSVVWRIFIIWISLSRLHPLHLLYFSRIPFFPSIFLLVYFPLPSLSFSFSVPSSVPSPPFPLSTVEGTASSLFKFIVLLNHDATRGRGKLITRPGRNLLVLFVNGGRERREQLWEIDSRSNALLIVEEDFPEYSSWF